MKRIAGNSNGKTVILACSIAIYFAISFIPVLAGWRVEIFPFFSFKLYSKIQTDLSQHDVLINASTGSSQFLIHDNHRLNRLQAKHYRALVTKAANNISTGTISGTQTFRVDEFSGKIVRIDADYIEAVRSGQVFIHEIEVDE